MASISTDKKNGTRAIQFYEPGTSKRKTIRLGKTPKKLAESIKVRIEGIIACRAAGLPLDAELAKWVGDLDKQLADRLAAVGLVDGQRRATLREHLDSYRNRRTDVKQATLTVWGQTIRNLCTFFGDDRLVHTIHTGDALDFKRFMLESKLAPTTIHKRLQFSRQFFEDMVDRTLVNENPFRKVSIKTGPPGRKFFVTREMGDKLIEAAPDAEWRSIIALSRHGGLRCPSEILLLRWEDINWDTRRITVTSPKTEHHPGRETRVAPLFPELAAVLQEAYELAPDGAEYVVTRYRHLAPKVKSGDWKNINLRTQLLRIIKRAGLTPWPKPWHNMLASRETELADTYPIHVVTAWLGNTPEVARKHYLQVTDDHFQAAVRDGEGTPDGSAAESGAVALRNAVPSVAAPNRKDGQETTEAPDTQGLLRSVAGSCESVHKPQVEAAGIEPASRAISMQASTCVVG